MTASRRKARIVSAETLAKERYVRRGAVPCLMIGFILSAAYVLGTLFITGGDLTRLAHAPGSTFLIWAICFVPFLAVIGAAECCVHASARAAWAALIGGLALLLAMMVYRLSLNSRGNGFTPLVAFRWHIIAALSALPVSVFIGLAVHFATRHLKPRRVLSRICSACRYDVAGLKAPARCPECGREFVTQESE